MFSSNATIIARPDSVLGYAPILGVTTLLGGGDDSFDGLDVDGLDDGYVLGVTLGDTLGWWKLRQLGVGEVEDGAGLIVPDGDAARVWVRVL